MSASKAGGKGEEANVETSFKKRKSKKEVCVSSVKWFPRGFSERERRQGLKKAQSVFCE